MLLAVPIFGPPAAGKTTLTISLGQVSGRRIFRLREHVPKEVLADTATSARRLGWIDEHTVTTALRTYFTKIAEDDDVHTVLLDNFPGSARQVDQLLATLWALTPCRIEAIELVANAEVLKQRARYRRVCHRCERDPISDPRMPAVPSADDPWRCLRCDNLLHPRRGDSPSLFRARMRRYQQAADAIRDAFRRVGIAVSQLDTSETVESATKLLAPLLISRSSSR